MSHSKAQGAPRMTKGKAMAAKQITKGAEAQAQAQEQGPTHYGIEALVEATGASGKDVRRWLRSAYKGAGAAEALPGKGGRYAFTTAQIEALASAYAKGKARKGVPMPDSVLKAL